MNVPGRQSRLTDLSPTRKEIELEIPDEEFRQEYERVLGEYVARAKLDGFRKGHAPRERVRGLFDHDITHDVYDALIPRVLEEELKAIRLNPVNVPELKDLKHEPGQPLRCTAAFEVLPDFDLPDYRTVRIGKKAVEVSEADLDKALEDIRARAAEYVPVAGRGVADGDYVVIEMQGRDDKTKRLLPVEKAVVLAGHAENEPALNEKLAGMTLGEERPFEVTYPKDHANRRVAGKDIVYSLKVREIKEKKLPDLDDEFAKSLGTPEGLADPARQGPEGASRRPGEGEPERDGRGSPQDDRRPGRPRAAGVRGRAGVPGRPEAASVRRQGPEDRSGGPGGL